MDDILHASIAQIAVQIRKGEISPVELIETTLQAIDQREPQLNAFITVFSEESLERARQAEAEIRNGEDFGPLHGMPIALKDIIYVEGTRSTAGSNFFAEESPQFDAALVSKLKDAGAVIIGKTNLHEFAFGVTTENPHFGATANPWDTARVPGGSSGGSAAAVIAGCCAGALGSDTGGSIRIPAAVCGHVGLKPTFGRTSAHGVLALAQSLDTVGPMCRYVHDVALMMNVLAGYDPRDVHSENQSVPDYTEGLDQPIRGRRAGIPKQHFFENLDSEVERVVGDAIKILEGLGVEIVELDLPSAPAGHEVTLTLLTAEAGQFHQERLAAHREDYGVDVRELLEQGLELSATDYVEAIRVREIAKREFVQAFDQVDCILSPTAPVPAPLRSTHDLSGGSESNRIRPRLTRNTRLINLLGLPSISVPCGFVQVEGSDSEQGLPVGLQISGPWWSEKTLLQISHAYEQATPWHTVRVKREA
ncbi:amidase [Candidatus Poribacteria bacterium]|nr:amidase [Candidatus Poribacteria bacterium]